MSGQLPVVGDVGLYRYLTGYKLCQERPWACRDHQVCQCPMAPGEPPRAKFRGGCYGWTKSVPAMVTAVVHYADNSIEVHMRAADGAFFRDYAKAPSGDLCY